MIDWLRTRLAGHGRSSTSSNTPEILHAAGIAIVVATCWAARMPPAAAQESRVENFPLSSVCDAQTLQQPRWKSSLKLVTFLPRGSNYEGMLKYAFESYFVRQMAFHAAGLGGNYERQILPIYVQDVAPPATGAPDIRTIRLGRDDSACGPTKDAQALASLAKSLNIGWPKKPEDSATVLLLDERNVVRWRDDDYRGQGEHLKPLEAKVKALLGRPDPVVVFDETPRPLRVGDMAPDFATGIADLLDPGTPGRLRPTGPARDTSSAGRKLSDLRGKVVLLTFYPAAFSGSLPTTALVDDAVFTSTLQAQRQAAMSCIGQIDSLVDRGPKVASAGKAPPEVRVVKLALSSSTPSLLEDWKRMLRSDDMQFVNDADYRIAQLYASYDAQAGYNRRAVYIVDKAGKIAYVNENYSYGDSQKIHALLDELSRKK